MTTDYRVTVFWGDESPEARAAAEAAGIDVEVALSDGSRWSATFFTLANIEALMEKDSRTGENHDGLYFYCTDMIIVRQLDQETIEATIADLLDESSFESAFQLLREDDDG